MDNSELVILCKRHFGNRVLPGCGKVLNRVSLYLGAEAAYPRFDAGLKAGSTRCGAGASLRSLDGRGGRPHMNTNQDLRLLVPGLAGVGGGPDFYV